MVEASTLQTILRSHQNLEKIEEDEVVEEKNSKTRDIAAELLSAALREAKFEAKIIDKETNTTTSESFELLQQQLDDATITADQRLHFKQKQQEHFQASKSTDDISEKLGYQLRALRKDISALESNPWLQAPTLPHIIQTSALSTELVNETLNYFLNCGQRLSQMTKTYDDNDAYMLLLQEKEVDLELAARIGQDLLKQNTQLKDSIKNLEGELAQRQNDLQQLRHELANKINLLDSFIEDEERQNSLVDSVNESTYRHHDLNNVNKQTVLNQQYPPQPPPPSSDFDDCSTGFLSLNYQNHAKTTPEPFSSLPHTFINAQKVESTLPLTRDDSASSICDDLNSSIAKSNNQQQKLVQTVTIQLVESNKRLCELQDELLYKSEQDLSRQEKIHQLQQQLNETERRLGDVASENENLHRSIVDSARAQNELSDELKTCKRNFDELLAVFLELQRESRAHRLGELQLNSNAFYHNGLGQPVSITTTNNNISFDSYNETDKLFKTTNQHDHHADNTSNNNALMTSLLEELEESIRNQGETSDGEATDGADSGVQASNRSSSVTPSTNAIGSEIDSEESVGKTRWVGLSSYMLTTILLLCLSVTLSSASSLDLAPKVKLGR